MRWYPRTTSSASQRAACFARAICSSCVPRSSGRSSALPPNATTASLRSVLNVIALERHRHAARSTARARQFVTLDLNRILLLRPRFQLVAAEKQIVFVNDLIAVRRQLFGGSHVSLVKHHLSSHEGGAGGAAVAFFPLSIALLLPPH